MTWDEFVAKNNVEPITDQKYPKLVSSSGVSYQFSS